MQNKTVYRAAVCITVMDLIVMVSPVTLEHFQSNCLNRYFFAWNFHCHPNFFLLLETQENSSNWGHFQCYLESEEATSNQNCYECQIIGIKTSVDQM